jgi:integrase
MRLTPLSVEALQPRADRFEVADSLLPSLNLVVRPSGTKSWAIRYRIDIGGRRVQQRHTLGTYPTLGVAAARAAARIALDKADAGEALSVRAETNGSPVAVGEASLAGVVQAVWADYLTTLDRPSTVARFALFFRKHVAPTLGTRPMDTIVEGDLRPIVNAAERRGPEAGNSAIVILSAFFGWASVANRKYIGHNPAAGFQKTKQASRERFLSNDEIVVFWHGCTELGYAFGHMYKLLLLTGARRNEVARMEWSEIVGDKWTIPGKRSKNGFPFTIILSPAALALLADMPRVNESRYVFSTNGRTPSSGFSKASTALDKLAPLPKWKLHDLRRTFASGLADLGVPVLVCDKCLNHVPKALSGVAKIYIRHEFKDQMAAAWKLWGDHVASLAKGPPPLAPS